MCIAALPAIAMVATLASTGMSVMGSIQQGKAASAQANYQAQVAENNAATSRLQAADAIERGKIEEGQHRKQVSRMIGQQRAGIAGSGFELGDETSQDILGDTASMGELDALTIRNNAQREAWGFEVQGQNATAEAGLSRMRGASAKTASYWQAGGDLLGGATKFATMGATNKKQTGSIWG